MNKDDWLDELRQDPQYIHDMEQENLMYEAMMLETMEKESKENKSCVKF